MPAKKQAAATRERVKLPDTVASSDEVEWPGTNRGRSASPLTLQIRSDLEGMNKGSVRRYNISGDKEQKAFASLFRKCVDEAFTDDNGEPNVGVQVAYADDAVFVKLGDRRAKK